MRSTFVFNAAKKIENRFLLCRMVCAATRAFHTPGVPIPETVNRALERVVLPQAAAPVPSAVAA